MSLDNVLTEIKSISVNISKIMKDVESLKEKDRLREEKENQTTNSTTSTSTSSIRGCSFEDISIRKQQNYCCDPSILVKQEGDIAERVDKLTKNIGDIINKIETQDDNIVESFFIGKTFVSTRAKKPFDPMNPNTWRKEGISHRWHNTYKEMGYEALIVLTVVTRNSVPEHTNQQEYAQLLEQRLISHYKIENHDERIQNENLSGGQKTDRCYMGYALYLAIKYETEVDIN